jgi:hypothetical protein
MRYTTFAIDDSRDHYTVPLRRYLNEQNWDYWPTEAVDGRDPQQLKMAQYRHGYKINFADAKVGHLGIWYTVLNAMEDIPAPFVTFEDDAILGEGFISNFTERIYRLNLYGDAKVDFFSLFIPRDSDHLYDDSMQYNSYLTRPYQRYGGVSMLYTERGIDKIKSLLRRDGITDQYDNTLYRYAKRGELNGLCSKPSLPDLVYISGTDESIVQESEIYVS